jgi:hypothetical protein
MRKGMRFEISDFIRDPRNGGVEEWSDARKKI